MGKLHELLAVDGDVQSVATKVTNEAIATFRTKADHFKGQTATKSFLDESKTALNTTVDKAIVSTVGQKLDFVSAHLAKSYDILLQKELSNSKATADIVLPDGTVLSANVPTMFLLTLENRLKQVREMIMAIPTLEPAIIWKEDGSQKDVFRADPVRTMTTEKSTQFKVLYEATKDHPAQIDKWAVDVPVAYTETTQFSAMWTVTRKSEALDRIDTLMQSVKQARMRANMVEVPPASIGRSLFQFILGA